MRHVKLGLLLSGLLFCISCIHSKQKVDTISLGQEVCAQEMDSFLSCADECMNEVAPENKEISAQCRRENPVDKTAFSSCVAQRCPFTGEKGVALNICLTRDCEKKRADAKKCLRMQ